VDGRRVMRSSTHPDQDFGARVEAGDVGADGGGVADEDVAAVDAEVDHTSGTALGPTVDVVEEDDVVALEVFDQAELGTRSHGT